MSKNIIDFVSAPMGSGKTTHTINFIKSSPDTDQFVIGTPNTTLSLETAARLAGEGVSVLQIDSTEGTNCKSALIAALQKGEHKVIIANRDVILKLDRQYFGTYHVILDEIMNPYERIDLDGIVISKNDIKSYFTVKPSKETPEFLECYATAEGLDFLSKWRSEGVYRLNVETDDKTEKNPLPRIIETMTNAVYRVQVEAAAYTKFSDDEGKRLSFFILARPSILEGFHTCTILGANFTDSLLHLLWRDDVDFQPHPVIKGDYDDFRHKAGLVKLYYFSKMNCTKHFMENLNCGVQGFVDRAAVAVADRFGKVPHIFCVNNPGMEKVNGKWRRKAPYQWALEESYDKEPNKGKRVSPDPNGINGLRDRNLAIHLAALNYGPMDFRFFERFFCIAPEEVVKAMTFERIAQFGGRTSLRDKDVTKEVTIVTFDRRSAEYLQGLIGCEAPEMIDLGLPELYDEKRMSEEEAKHAHNAKVQRYRDRVATEERLAAHDATQQQDGFGCRIWKSKYSQDAENEAVYGVLTLDDFVDQLRSWAEDEIKFKNDLNQLRVGLFGDLTSHLTADNLISSNMLMLDVDGSSRRPEELEEFLHTSLNLTAIIVQSFSSKYEDPRFHLFIPLDASVNEDNYRHIARLVMADINARFAGAFDFDTGFASINKRMSVPCKSKFDADKFIYRRAWKDVLTKELRLLDVVEYLNRRLPKKTEKAAEPGVAQVEIDPNDHLAMQAIVDEYAAQCVDGKRDDMFKKAGYVLFVTGFHPPAIVTALEQNLDRFGKANDKKAAERLVDWLIRKGTKITDLAA